MKKELKFQVSCSYGPGRYDKSYEEMANDYPLPFVRWTEQRNFEAILDMMATGKIDVKPLISKRVAFEDAEAAYMDLSKHNTNLGILLEYKSENKDRSNETLILNQSPNLKSLNPNVTFIGAGNYASRTLIPAFKKAGANLHTLTSSNGVSGTLHGIETGFLQTSTDTAGSIDDEKTDTIVIATRHDTHANLVNHALKSGKHVFVEKPLAIDVKSLKSVQSTYKKIYSNGPKPQLMVGFNRRFSPLVQKMKRLIQSVDEPKSFIMTMNAGAVPVDHWVQDYSVGGGRIVGEACHYIDLMRFLADAEITSVQARRIGDHPALDVTEDKASITLGFSNGSFGTILYLANGSAKYPKERIEVFVGNRVLKIDNFLSLNGFGWKNFKKKRLWRQDKGQVPCVSAFLSSIKNGIPAIPVNELFEVARISIEVSNILRRQK